MIIILISHSLSACILRWCALTSCIKVPAKPTWYSRINDIVRNLQALPRPFIDRATVEFLLGVGRRRAQQIMAPCITDHVGANGLADRDRLITHLLRLAQGEEGYYEVQRRRKVAGLLHRLRMERVEQPQLLVEAPVRVVNQEFENLPPGVLLKPGRVTVEFREPREALEKLLALAMAISNDFDRFERITRLLS
jgi:hypothetical protein